MLCIYLLVNDGFIDWIGFIRMFLCSEYPRKRKKAVKQE